MSTENTIKSKAEPIIEIEEQPVTEIKAKPVSRSVSALLGVLNGSILTRESILKQIPFILFMAFIAMVYIANSYYAERMIKEINATTNELKELRSEYITTKSDLMHLSKQSEVAKSANKFGLKESTTPPKKIVAKK